MSSRVTLKLMEPVQFGSTEIEELSLRRIKGKDLRKFRDPENMSTADTLEMLSLLSGQPSKVIDELDAEDIRKALEIVRGFTESGQKTGEVL